MHFCKAGQSLQFLNQKKPSSRNRMWKIKIYEHHLKEAWCCARNGFPQQCSLSGTRSCSCSSPTTLNLLRRWPWLTVVTPFSLALFCSPWHRRTGWMRIACCSGGDLRVTRAASPRSAWAKRTEQVRGEGGLKPMLDICHPLIGLRFWRVLDSEHITVSGLACSRSHPRWSHWICMQQA